MTSDKEKAFDDFFHPIIKKPMFWQIRKKAVYNLKKEMENFIDEMLFIHEKKFSQLEHEIELHHQIPAGLLFSDVYGFVNEMDDRDTSLQNKAEKYGLLKDLDYENYLANYISLRDKINSKYKLVRGKLEREF